MNSVTNYQFVTMQERAEKAEAQLTAVTAERDELRTQREARAEGRGSQVDGVMHAMSHLFDNRDQFAGEAASGYGIKMDNSHDIYRRGALMGVIACVTRLKRLATSMRLEDEAEAAKGGGEGE